MSVKVAHYLQQHLRGEVMTSRDALKYFSTDGSVFEQMPAVIVYPRNTADVRKSCRFVWQLAEKGHIVPITARGKGTDQAGAALGKGIIMVFPAHMNKILEIDKNSATVQPGLIYAKLEQTLHTHGRFLPPYPSSIEFSTLGGAVANNAAGEKTVKYGQTREFVKSLNVVLANGELISTKRLTAKQLAKKRELTTFEGEIYRSLDDLISENWGLINEKQNKKVSKNSSGYDLIDVKRSDGSFDLTPLIVGSQGTLGVVTQINLKTVPYNPKTSLIAAFFDDVHKFEGAVSELLGTEPSALEVVDDNLLEFVKKHNPNQLKGIIDEKIPKLVLLVEYDNASDRVRSKKTKQAKKILNRYSYEYQVTSDIDEQEQLWKIRHSAAAVIWQVVGKAKAVPIIEDGVVPRERFIDYLNGVYALYNKYKLDAAVWGHAGDSNLHMQPFLDLSNPEDRKKVFKIADDYYRMVLEMGGSTSGEHNDGRLRAPYLPFVYGKEMYALFRRVKNIFDPYGIMNPGVKIDVRQSEIAGMLRQEYSMEHLYDHMPRS